MGSLSIWHWLIFIFFIVVLGIPIARILTRIGYSKWWTIFIHPVRKHRRYLDFGLFTLACR